MFSTRWSSTSGCKPTQPEQCVENRLPQPGLLSAVRHPQTVDRGRPRLLVQQIGDDAPTERLLLVAAHPWSGFQRPHQPLGRRGAQRGHQVPVDPAVRGLVRVTA